MRLEQVLADYGQERGKESGNSRQHQPVRWILPCSKKEKPSESSHSFLVTFLHHHLTNHSTLSLSPLPVQLFPAPFSQLFFSLAYFCLLLLLLVSLFFKRKKFSLPWIKWKTIRKLKKPTAAVAAITAATMEHRHQQQLRHRHRHQLCLPKPFRKPAR
ncbi:hypothetical protein MUK42_13906 [Musa troglodytarum]|uniref:Uncharacterized protein n=1 Tax=Musa troglodytarum TaxID=320322 RepID=A0A9E7IFY7_9LILI|nr:hypothetical protein MUK42_13906 [Musa troglodytarum]